MLTTSQALSLFKNSRCHADMTMYLYGAGSDASVFKVDEGALKITQCEVTDSWLQTSGSFYTPKRKRIEVFRKNNKIYYAWIIERLEKLDKEQSQYWESLKFKLNQETLRRDFSELQKLQWLKRNDSLRSKEWDTLSQILSMQNNARLDVFTAGNVLSKNGAIILSDPLRLLKSPTF